MSTGDSYEEYEQDHTSVLVRSLALSSAKLWEELFARLQRIEASQDELRELVGRIQGALPEGTSELSAALLELEAEAEHGPSPALFETSDMDGFASAPYSIPRVEEFMGTADAPATAELEDAELVAPAPAPSAVSVPLAPPAWAPMPLARDDALDDGGAASSATLELHLLDEIAHRDPFAPVAPLTASTPRPPVPPIPSRPAPPPPPLVGNSTPMPAVRSEPSAQPLFTPPAPPPPPLSDALDFGLSKARPAAPPPPPPGYALDFGLSKAGPPPPPPGFALAPVPPPPVGYTILRPTGTTDATGTIGAMVPADAGVLSDDPATVRVIGVSADQEREPPAQVGTPGAGARAESPQAPPPIAPDFFARAGRRRH